MGEDKWWNFFSTKKKKKNIKVFSIYLSSSEGVHLQKIKK